ncbi:MAG: MFS transporter [Pseudomonadota bacterium]
MNPFFAILLLYGMGLTASMQVGLMGPIALSLRAGFDLSQAQFGLVASLITAAGALFAIPAGIWASRLGLKQSVLLGGSMMIIGSIVFSSADITTQLYVGRLITSIGYLLIVVAAPSWMTRLGDARIVAFAMSIWGTFVPVGIALGLWLSAGLVETLGWRVAVMASGVPVIVLLPGLLLFPNPALQFDRSMISGILGVLTSRAALQVALTFGVFAGATSAAITFMPAMLVERLAISTATAATLIGVTTILGNVAGSIAAGMMLARGNSGRPMITMGLIVMAASIATVFLTGSLMGIIAALGFFNLAQGVVAGTCFALLPGIAGRHLSMPALQGMLAQFAEIFVVLLPPVTGAIADAAGWRGSAFILAGFYLTGMAVILIRRRIT